MTETRLIEEKEGHYTLIKRVDLTDLCQLNYEERKIIGKGFTQGKTMRKIASIPIEAILSEPVEVQEALMKDPMALKKWLREHPEYLTCEGRF